MTHYNVWGLMALPNHESVSVQLTFSLREPAHEDTVSFIATRICKANGLEFLYWED